MNQDRKGCLQMLSELIVAALVLTLTILALVFFARITPGGPYRGKSETPEIELPHEGTPAEVSEALELALETPRQ